MNQPGLFSHPGKSGATIARLPRSSLHITLAQRITSESRWPAATPERDDLRDAKDFTVFNTAERLALAGFLTGYSGLNRQADELDLRQYAAWCRTRHLRLFYARRADIECFARDLEARGRGWTTSRTPPPWTAMLVAAGLGPPAEHALVALLALNGLRVSEATGADIEAMGIERGHRTLVITRKGGKVVTIPLAPRTARAIDLAVSERCEGPVFLAADGRRLDRHGAGRIVRRVARRAGITKPVGPHTLRHAFITAAQMSRVAAAARRAGSRLTCRPADHHALRPGQSLPRPPRHLHRRRLRCRRRPIGPDCQLRRLARHARPGGRLQLQGAQTCAHPRTAVLRSPGTRAVCVAHGRITV